MTVALLGLDLGTTTVKAVALTPTGETICTSNSKPIALHRGNGHATQNGDEIVAAAFDAIRLLLPDLPTHTSIAAIAMAAQSGSVAPFGADDMPLTHFTTWMDTRSDSIVDRWLEDGTGLRIAEVSGWQPGSGLGLSSIAWLGQNRPDIFNKACRYAGVDEFVVHALTGSWRANTSNASGMQLMNVHSAQWSQELCEVVRLRTDQLSALTRPGESIDTVTEPPAAGLERLVGATVVTGGHDQSCHALGLGLTRQGDVLLAAGTAWVLTAIADHSTPTDLPAGMSVSHHVAPGRFTISRYLGGHGATAEAVRQHDASGKALDTAMRSASHQVEEALAEFGQVTSLTMVGGAATDDTWPRLVAGAAGVPVRVVQDHALPAKAAAVLAGVGVGILVDVDDVSLAPDHSRLIDQQAEENLS